MTSASKARIQRRAEKALSDKMSYKPGDAPKSILTLTEIPNTGGGFTIGLGLHGARMNELYPGKPQPVTVVDILALTLADLIRNPTPEFEAAFEKTKQKVLGIEAAINSGVAPEDAVAGLVSGEAPAEEDEADVVAA